MESNAARRLLVVLVRPQHPDERLNVDHVAWSQVRQIASYDFGELKETRVSFPRRVGLVLEAKAVLAGGGAGDVQFEIDVHFGLCEKAAVNNDARPHGDGAVIQARAEPLIDAEFDGGSKREKT